MKCPYCSQEIPDGSNFCTFCGKSIDSNEPAVEATETVEGVSETTEALQETVVEKVEVTEADSMPVTETGEEAKKGGSGKKIGIAVAAVVAVGALAFASTQLFGGKDPKNTVIDAFKSVTAEGQVSPMDEIFGSKALGERLMNENAEIMTSIKLESISDANLAMLEGASFGLTAKQDVANNKYSMIFGAGYGDMNIANFEMYFDDKSMVLAVPEISSKSFSINYADDLAGQIEKSPYLGQYFAQSGVDAQSLQEYFSYISETSANGGDIMDIKGFWERYKEGSKAIDDLKAAMTVEKSEKKDLTMDGKQASCQGYKVTITKDAFVQFLKTSREFLLQDETLKKEFVSYMTQVMKFSSYSMSYYGATPDAEEQWKQMETMTDQMITELEKSLGDVAMNVYVDSKGRLAAIDGTTTATVEGEELSIDFEAEFQGGYRLTANGKGSVTFTADDQSVLFGFERASEYDKEKFSSNGKLYAEIEGETGEISYKGIYKLADGSYEVTADIGAAGENFVSISADGVVQDIEKGKKITVLMNNLTFDVIPASVSVELSGDYRVMDLEGDVDMPTGTPMDILAATEEEWQAVIEEAYGNIMGIAMKLMQ